MRTLASPELKTNIALGYVRKEVNATGGKLTLKSAPTESTADIVETPFS